MENNSKSKRTHDPEDLEWEDYNETIEDGIDLSQVMKPNKDDDKIDAEEGVVNVEFVYVDPSENQRNSIKSLVNGLLDGLSYKSSELAEIITEQVVVGTMIGLEEDENANDRNILGFASILNLKQYQNRGVMKEMIGYILGKSETHNSYHQDLVKCLQTETEKIGVYINERMLNLPPYLVPTLHNQICEDIKWVIQENQPEAPQFDLKYMLFMTKVYKEVKRSNKKKNTESYEDFIYQKFEDYVFSQKALMRFTFEAKSSKSMAGLTNLETEQDEQVCYRLIYLMNFEDYYNCVQDLPNHLEEKPF